ncbi:hypothetical protein QFC22_002354 [Naganishia vaughanmartiniae]|uniref:Uncharacterized protein n=1 Tax=Naganishia vaughanmartiniae TaxID=1424756 RepID=A0ACC2XCH0_9TREE|nr:hypothetical protein QFC22_002354 [Naganishia vaughanmartiniae]
MSPPSISKSPSDANMDSKLSSALTNLSNLLADKEYVLATAQGDGELAKTALNAAKSIFDLGISLEHSSHPHLHPLLTSVIEPPPLMTRSKANAKKGKKGSKDDREPEAKKAPVQTAESLLPYTPLDGLYTEGMNFAQIWQQLELRSGKLGDVLKVVGIESAEPKENDDDAGMDSEDSEESDEDDERENDILDFEGLDDEQKAMWLEYLKENPDEFVEKFDDDGDDMSEEDVSGSDDDDEEDSSDSESDLDDDMEGSGGESGDDDADMDEEMSGDESSAMEEDDDAEDDEAEETSVFQTRRGPQHPTLDDQFFSIEDFNRVTEEQEAGKASLGKLGSSKDEDDEETDIRLDEDIGDLLGEDVLEGEEGEADMMYADFFPPPPRDRSKPPPRKHTDEKKDKKGKGKASVRFSEGEDKADVHSDADAAGPSSSRDIMSRVREDLFAEDDEAEVQAATANLSTHEKRTLALQEQIAAFEQENVGKKDWTLLGEATAKARPENSLLEETLDFEHSGKVVPLVTEEKVLSLEEMIKKRILDTDFNDVVRRREIDDKAFLPSRYFELQDAQSTRSLAQIYEDEYQAAATGSKATDPRDAKLAKDHEEIEKLWGDICYKLDALSNLHFTPKAPKATITTLSNVATASMEDALPTTQSAATMLAPEEMLAPAAAAQLVSRTELTPEEKRRSRQKTRKSRATQRKALDVAVDKFAGKSGAGAGRARGGVKGEKDRALQELVKTGKGVTIVGQQPAKKRGTRPTSASAGPSVGLKL